MYTLLIALLTLISFSPGAGPVENNPENSIEGTQSGNYIIIEDTVGN